MSGDPNDGNIGVAAADFDNDGWVDIYVTQNGGRHKLYRNNADDTFTDIAIQAGILEENNNSVALADFNNDGWMDIFTAAFRSRLMRNGGGSNNWIMITPRGTRSNHFAVGTRIEVYAGGMMQIREIRAGDSFCSQSDQLRAHFGLGTATVVDSLVLRWPSGVVQQVSALSANQFLIIQEDSLAVGISEGVSNSLPTAFALKQNYPNPFNPSTTIEYSLSSAANVKLSIYNLLGEEVQALVNDFQAAGSYQVTWNAITVNGLPAPSGIYLYRIETESFVDTRKMILIR